MFYTYILRDPVTGCPFYVGKGHKNRMYAHWRSMLIENKDRFNPKLRNKLASILRRGFPGPIYEKWLETPDELPCYWAEVFLIKIIGLVNLCNILPGGDSPPSRLNAKVTSETKAKMSTSAIKYNSDPEVRREKAEHLARVHSDPIIKIRRTAKLRKTLSLPDVKAKQTAGIRRSFTDPVLLEARNASIRLYLKTPEAKASRSAKTRISWKDPVIRERRTAALRISAADPENRKKRSASGKLAHGTPERRRKKSEEQTRTMAAKSPEERSAIGFKARDTRRANAAARKAIQEPVLI